MLNTLQGFDPVKFLEINTDSYTSEGVAKLKEALTEAMGEYILLKISSELSEEHLNQLTTYKDPMALFNYLNGINPNLNQKIIEELENFKSEYLKEQKIN